MITETWALCLKYPYRKWVNAGQIQC